jgi:tetratricopeptide (TPR) repeat protein
MSDPKFEAYIKQIYQKITVQNVNYFDLLGLVKTATHREIEANYRKYVQYFSPERINILTDPELKQMGNLVIEKLNRAHEVLTDYGKKAEYEKRGFREFSPEMDEPEEEPEEKAKIIYKKAKSLHAQRQYEMGVKAMHEAIKLDPKVASYYLLLGMCQTQIAHLKTDAEKNLRKASDMESWNAEPYVALGMLFYSEKLFKRAEPFFRKALELENNHALAKRKLAEIAVPEETIIDKVHNVLKKALPSIFGRTK